MFVSKITLASPYCRECNNGSLHAESVFEFYANQLNIILPFCFAIDLCVQHLLSLDLKLTLTLVTIKKAYKV